MKKLKINASKICQGYEDKDHPCYICFIKGVCSSQCQEIWDYEKDLQKSAVKLGHELVPKPFTRKILRIGAKTIEYSIKDIMDYFKAIEGKKVVGILKNPDVVLFIKKAQYTTNRQEFILKNYMNRNPNFSGSMSSSSVSGSSYGSSYAHHLNFPNSNPPPFAKPPKKLNQNLVRRNI